MDDASYDYHMKAFLINLFLFIKQIRIAWFLYLDFKLLP